jgi:NitT/TauT family transport system permease protein
MFQRKLQLGLLLSAGALALAFLLPLAPQAKSLLSHPIWPLVAGAGVLFVLAAWVADDKTPAIGIGGVFLAAATSLVLLHDPDIAGSARSGFWIIVTAAWLASVVCVVDLAGMRPIRAGRRRFLNLLVPLLGADFVQTFGRGVLIGYAIGCGAGLVVAILAHRFAFLGRGLLPLGNFFSALPLVGIAPIMVMWFGFDWPSKAAVVALVTFFPMLVNALAGLSASGHIERDLMRSYAASYPQALGKLYLPAALPFIFNALKINATLALIGAIVAEFFGTPTQGIGFRISTEAGRMAIDMVWAEIALAALAGMAFYGFVALAERATTFWHPSYRT